MVINLRRWAEREFGEKHATEIADIVAKYSKYNGRRKPELLEPGTFSLNHYDEADRIVAEWKAIAEKAEKIYARLPLELRDAFYQLVLHPTKASAIVTELYTSVAKNRAYAKEGDARANEFAKRARELFKQDAEMSDYYNRKLAGGKWNHMMDQTHIGYTSWQQPPSNVMPGVTEVTNAVATKDERAQKNKADKSNARTPKGWLGFVETDGYVSIEAEHFTRKTDTATARWEVLPDHGESFRP